jgi:hypothetical protein
MLIFIGLHELYPGLVGGRPKNDYGYEERNCQLLTVAVNCSLGRSRASLEACAAGGGRLRMVPSAPA